MLFKQKIRTLIKAEKKKSAFVYAKPNLPQNILLPLLPFQNALPIFSNIEPDGSYIVLCIVTCRFLMINGISKINI